MELWMIYAILWGVFVGISNFLSKSVAYNWINKYRVSLIIKWVFLLCSSIFLLFNLKYVEFSLLLWILIIWREIFATEKWLFIMESLKYIESTIFFPIHKVINYFVALFVWMLIFDEYLWNFWYIALILAIFMVLLLTDNENKKAQINYKKWIFYLILSNIAVWFSSSINKYFSSINFDIPTYIFLSSIVWCVYMLTTKKGAHIESDKKIHKKELKFWIIKWLSLYWWFWLLLLSLKWWEFVLVNIIFSSSIFIPIILSIIFYKEVVNLKKILAFMLFLVIIVLLSYK